MIIRHLSNKGEALRHYARLSFLCIIISLLTMALLSSCVAARGYGGGISPTPVQGEVWQPKGQKVNKKKAGVKATTKVKKTSKTTQASTKKTTKATTKANKASTKKTTASSSQSKIKGNGQLEKECNSWIGTPHRYGGTSRSGVDCSGFTQAIYRSVYGIELIHNSHDQLTKNCKKRLTKSQLQKGDLVFFVTNGKSPKVANINHVGIYLGDGKFVHASTSKGVIVNRLTDSYYVKNWVSGGRVF